MKIILTESQLRMILEQKNTSDISTYPACISNVVNPKDFLIRSRGKIVKTKSGQEYVILDDYPGYGFYNNGRAMKPGNIMGSYTCNQRDIIVDGVNLREERWQREKNNYVTDYERRELAKAESIVSNLDPHNLATVFSIATAFIPVVGPFISGGIQLADAALYYNKGDTKSAGMSAMFAIIPVIGPLVSKIPGAKQLGAKGMQMLASKLSKGGQGLTTVEKEVVDGIVQNKELVNSELNNYVKSVSANTITKATNSAVKQDLKKLAVGGLKFTGTVAGYGAVGMTYDKGYDYVRPNTMNNLAGIDVNKISKANIDAAKTIKFD